VRRRLIALAVLAASPAQARPASDPVPDEVPAASAPDPAGVAPAPLFEPAPTGPTGPTAPPLRDAARAAPRAGDPGDASDDIGDQAISAQVGLAAGGRVTPGGLRLTGHYLYQLSERDWFDGAASFTFGSGAGACFRDRQDGVICRHGLTDGSGIEVVASIRHMLPPRGAFRPFARAGLGFGLARFSGDDLSGFAVPLHGGGGLWVTITNAIAIVAEADLALGVGSFGRGLGAQPQLGFTVGAGAEFRLR